MEVVVSPQSERGGKGKDKSSSASMCLPLGGQILCEWVPLPSHSNTPAALYTLSQVHGQVLSKNPTSLSRSPHHASMPGACTHCPSSTSNPPFFSSIHILLSFKALPESTSVRNLP